MRGTIVENDHLSIPISFINSESLTEFTTLIEESEYVLNTLFKHQSDEYLYGSSPMDVSVFDLFDPDELSLPSSQLRYIEDQTNSKWWSYFKYKPFTTDSGDVPPQPDIGNVIQISENDIESLDQELMEIVYNVETPRSTFAFQPEIDISEALSGSNSIRIVHNPKEFRESFNNSGLKHVEAPEEFELVVNNFTKKAVPLSDEMDPDVQEDLLNLEISADTMYELSNIFSKRYFTASESAPIVLGLLGEDVLVDYTVNGDIIQQMVSAVGREITVIPQISKAIISDSSVDKFEYLVNDFPEKQDLSESEYFELLEYVGWNVEGCIKVDRIELTKDEVEKRYNLIEMYESNVISLTEIQYYMLSPLISDSTNDSIINVIQHGKELHELIQESSKEPAQIVDSKIQEKLDSKKPFFSE